MGLVILVGLALLYTFGLICVLMWDCIHKIPGAAEDKKFQKISKYFQLSWYFPVDKTPPRDYNDNMKPRNPYRDAWHNDPYRKDWTKR